MKKVLLVTDVNNLYFCVRKKFNDRRLDYRKLLEGACNKNEELYRAIAYGILTSDNLDKFIGMLRAVGFETRYKNDDPRRPMSCDVDMAMDVVQMLDSVDIVVFATSDADLEPCVNYVKSKGKEARAIASNVSRELRAAANHCREIPESWLLEAAEPVELHGDGDSDDFGSPTGRDTTNVGS
jgi:uncharacterized LabA/DUF88 family protein